MEFKLDSVISLYLAGKLKVATATSAEMVRKVKKRLDRNPSSSGRKMACEVNIAIFHSANIEK